MRRKRFRSRRSPSKPTFLLTRLAVILTLAALTTSALADGAPLVVFDQSPADTVPAHLPFEIRWHAEALPPASGIAGYEYALAQAPPPAGSFVAVDSSVHSATFNTRVGADVVPAGTQYFTLRATDDLGATTESTLVFQLNFPPDTWFSGPDPSLYAPMPPRGERYLDVDWSSPPPFPGSLLSCDSLELLPAERPQRRTFFEIYTAPGVGPGLPSRVYVRSEFDTVNMNSWVLIHSGGSDLDSPYSVRVNANDPALGDTADCPGVPAWVLRPDTLNGSPIGFHLAAATYLTPSGPLSAPAQSSLYPIFDATSIFRNPVIGGYRVMRQAGKVYLVTRAEDGDGALDWRLGTPQEIRALADKVDAGLGTPEELALRSKILVFYVDQPPRLLFAAPGFVPTPGQSFPSRCFDVNLLATDDDPWNFGSPPGGPAPSPVLRWSVTVRGRDAADHVIDYLVTPDPVFDPHLEVCVPDNIVGTSDTLKVQLCDCAFCELAQGSGRCVSYDIPIQVPPGGPTPALASLASVDATPDRVVLRWLLGQTAATRVERRSPESGWRDLGEAEVGGAGEASYEDRAVEAGARYGYRLSLVIDGEWRSAGETWVDVPSASLTLEGVRPNPTVGSEWTVHLSLPGRQPARLEVLDVSGRRWTSREVGSLGPGTHAVRLRSAERMPPGVYRIRLIQGSEVREARAVVLK